MMPADDAPRAAWVVQRELSAEQLVLHVTEHRVSRERLIAVLEPQPGLFTLIYEASPSDLAEAPVEETRAELEAVAVVEQALEESEPG
jgi:hypothetical protein